MLRIEQGTGDALAALLTLIADPERAKAALVELQAADIAARQQQRDAKEILDALAVREKELDEREAEVEKREKRAADLNIGFCFELNVSALETYDRGSDGERLQVARLLRRLADDLSMTHVAHKVNLLTDNGVTIGRYSFGSGTHTGRAQAA